MDGQRFDELTRALTRDASRRGVIRGLVGGGLASALALARGRGSAAAQATQSPLGGVCRATGDCRQRQGCEVPGSVVCADNGLSGDGALNCCLNEGGLCGVDAHCCGGLLCLGGGGDGCGAGRCGIPSSTGLSLGSPCTASNQCGQVGEPTVCASNGLVDDGTLNCCRNAGGACPGNRACCGSLLCVDGVCGGGSADGGLLAPGNRCFYPGQCDQTGGATDCATNGISTDGALNCCRYTGGACTGGAGCCGALACIGGICR